MDLRITTQVQVNRALDNVRRETDQIANLQEQAQTGLRVNKPSDEPLAMVGIIQSTAQDSRLTNYLGNMTDATNTLNSGVSTLTDVSNALTSAHQIALEGANATTTTSTDFGALVDQVDQLLNRVIADSNTTVDGRTLFGGTATEQPAFTVTKNVQGKPTAVVYQGADQPVSAPIGPGETVNTNYAGDRIFQQPGSDVFQALITLRDNLSKAAAGNVDTTALNQSVTDLQNAQQAVLGTVGTMSAHLEALSALQTRLQDVQTQVKSHLGDLQSADLASVVLNLSEQQNLYSATPATSAQIFSQDLLDFLK
jgi:flagellar hook-associated protein 3 FlgL